MKRFRLAVLLLVAFALVAAACSSDSDDTTTTAAGGDETTTTAAETATTAAGETTTTAATVTTEAVSLEGTTVTVFGPEASDEEAGAMQDALNVFAEANGMTIVYTGARDFSDQINAQAAGGNPPDIAIFPQPGKVADFADEGFILPLPDAVTSTVNANWPEAFVSFGNVDGVQYGVPNKADIKSLVWYDSVAFAENGYAIPETLDELWALGDQMVANGQTPWCVGIESGPATGWPFTDWVEDIVLRQHGPDVYDLWVEADVSFEDDRIIAAFETFGEIVHHPGRVLGGTQRILNTSWTQAQDPMFDIPARCLLHRQGSVQEAQLPSWVTIGTETDAFVLPAMDGGEPPILAAGEFAAAFTDRPEVHALLQYLATPEAGAAWAAAGGFVSPHASFDSTIYGDDLDRRMAEIMKSAEVIRLDGSDAMVPSVGTGTFWTGMVSYIRSGDARTVAAEIQAGYPEVTHFPEVPVSEG
ncbi:MAG: ABC transporter substrate-binding protein [Acidimicrobiia bacterium]